MLGTASLPAKFVRLQITRFRELSDRPFGVNVLYAISWRGVPAVRNTATERFLKTGGKPPAGVKMVGRWHGIGRISGTAIAETDDPTFMAKWALEWNDLFETDVRPVMTDEQAGPLMAQIGKQ